MKKFVSMAMVAAMTVSMVPATAFAAGSVTTSIKPIDALELTKDEATANKYIDDNNKNNTPVDNYKNEVPELKIKIDSVDYRGTDAAAAEAEVTLTLDNAEFLADSEDAFKALVTRFNKANTVQAWNDPSAGVTAATSNWTADPAGKQIIDITSAKHDVDTADKHKVEVVLAETDFEELTGVDALEYEFDAGNVELIASTTANIVYTPDGEADVVVYDDSNDTWAAGWSLELLVANLYLEAGVIKSGHDQIEVDGTPIANQGALDALSVDAATQFEAEVAANYTASKYERGDLVVTAATGTVDNKVQVAVKEFDEDEVTFVFTGFFAEDDYLLFNLESVLDKTTTGRTATVSVSGDLGEAEDMVYVSVLGTGITATTKKIANVAEEERVTLEKDLKIKSAVGKFADGQTIELKLSNGFEFGAIQTTGTGYYLYRADDDTVELTVDGNIDEITVKAEDIEIEAVSAKTGAVATLKVKAINDADGAFNASTTVEVAKVVDYKVMLSVDADEDVPVIYSGVNVENTGITDDSDHLSLEITAEETFPGAWSMRKGFNFELPEGVYVTDVKVLETENFYLNAVDATDVDVENAFWNAYIDGEHKNFEFEKRVFDDVDNNLRNKECATMTFELELVADPGFVGDVNLKLTGDLVDEQEVTIAKFATPFVVKAEQNDLKIDYRYTEIPTAITVTETEAGLWKEDAMFRFEIEGEHMTFEDDPTFDVTGGLEIKDEEANKGKITFTVDDESDEAATVTISGMELYMDRSIPAGPYDLEIGTSMGAGYITEVLFAPDELNSTVYIDRVNDYGITAWNPLEAERPKTTVVKEDTFVDDVADFSTVVKEAFVNVVTAGREQDDASFTTKVVVPVGESYIVAGEHQVTLDVPAYVSAAGYTMLPVRAVATALGINNNNVIWNGETKTVTILYGQRIITMAAGEKAVHVNGSVIPASAAVEIVDGRTFLPMRDLATALGVTDITWDAATKTATLNGNA